MAYWPFAGNALVVDRICDDICDVPKPSSAMDLVVQYPMGNGCADSRFGLPFAAPLASKAATASTASAVTTAVRNLLLTHLPNPVLLQRCLPRVLPRLSVAPAFAAAESAAAAAHLRPLLCDGFESLDLQVQPILLVQGLPGLPNPSDSAAFSISDSAAFSISATAVPSAAPVASLPAAPATTAPGTSICMYHPLMSRCGATRRRRRDEK